ncbi:sporulation protein [Nannocystis pusilla]|uniref:Sporulation protein n=1 Tax=Nannocystis pusilla TaxID=889268 RepID=A0ABS7TI98_9BACT|nr:sporulation protein [Nannocystis pusilla]MBZ5707932.1 sporulation protein [Nannocystis pusilla]
MEILDRLKSIVGIGKATIELSQVDTPVRAGAELHARVTLRGGDYDVTVQDVRLHFDEERMVYTAQGRGDFAFWQQHASITIPMGGLLLAKGEEMSLPVVLTLPADLAPNAEALRYVLVAETEIPGLNPKHAVPVEVVA